MRSPNTSSPGTDIPWSEAEVCRRWQGRGPELWREATRLGGPIHLAGGEASTFLFRSTAPAVHLRINRLTDKHNMALGMMRRVAGTDIWVKTLRTGPRLRASYGFLELDGPAAPPPIPPEHDSFALWRDPLNRMPPVVDVGGGRGLSLLAGEAALGATDTELWAHATQSPGARVAHEGGRMSYFPPVEQHLSQPVPVLLISDAEQWFLRYGLASALDLAIAKGILPPLVVCGEGFATREERLSSLRANPDYLERLVGADLEYAREELVARGQTPGPVILAGQSLGGLTALWALTTAYAPRIDAVLAQSPSLWFTPGTAVSPARLPGLDNPWIAQVLRSCPPLGIPIHLEVGLREGRCVAAVEKLSREMLAAGWQVTAHTADGGHDFASWRYGLIGLLAEVLGQLGIGDKYKMKGQ